MHISSTKPTNTYTLDVILSVGYRVNSAIATKFRRWATKTLSEYRISRLEPGDRLIDCFRQLAAEACD